jgi:hypothetical protein
MIKEVSPIGFVESWEPDNLKRVVESLVEADEVELALKALQCVPARYRDARDKGLEKLRQDILSSMLTPHAYVNCGLDCEVNYEKGNIVFDNAPRGRYILQEVSRYNAQLECPHIVDMGPGEFFVPIGLSHHQRQFTYEPLALDKTALEQAQAILKGFHVAAKKEHDLSPYIFIAFEIIEHLPSIQDIAIEAFARGNPDRVYLSTPHYSYDGRKKDWRKRNGLPHLRAYTPNEFYDAAKSLFPGYAWIIDARSPILLARGMRNDVVDKEPLEIMMTEKQGVTPDAA